MLKHWAAALSVLALAACASPAPPESGDLGPPPTAAPATPAATAPAAAAPNVAAPAATPEARPNDDSVVVPGARPQPVRPPPGDPRSVAERTEDVRAWDQCVSRAQAQFETDPMRPQLETPEDVCSRSLGMSNRLAVPASRRP